MQITPIVPPGRQLIERYGPLGFRVSGTVYAGSVLVFPDRTLEWHPISLAEIDLASLEPVIADGRVDILLLGLGRRAGALATGLRAALRAAGVAAEAMDTGAACRTYNVLLAEDRRIAAALLPPS